MQHLLYFHSSAKCEVITEIYIQVRENSFRDVNINWGWGTSKVCFGRDPKLLKGNKCGFFHCKLLT